MKIDKDFVIGNAIAFIIIVIWLTISPLSLSRKVVWEYKIEAISDIVFDWRMQEIGKEGWELVSARRAITGEGEASRGIYECIFSRKK